MTTQSQIATAKASGATMVSAYDGSVLSSAPISTTMVPNGSKPYHVANYIPQTNEIVYHGFGKK